MQSERGQPHSLLKSCLSCLLPGCGAQQAWQALTEVALARAQLSREGGALGKHPLVLRCAGLGLRGAAPAAPLQGATSGKRRRCCPAHALQTWVTQASLGVQVHLRGMGQQSRGDRLRTLAAGSLSSGQLLAPCLQRLRPLLPAKV